MQIKTYPLFLLFIFILLTIFSSCGGDNNTVIVPSINTATPDPSGYNAYILIHVKWPQQREGNDLTLRGDEKELTASMPSDATLLSIEVLKEDDPNTIIAWSLVERPDNVAKIPLKIDLPSVPAIIKAKALDINSNILSEFEKKIIIKYDENIVNLNLGDYSIGLTPTTPGPEDTCDSVINTHLSIVYPTPVGTPTPAVSPKPVGGRKIKFTVENVTYTGTDNVIVTPSDIHVDPELNTDPNGNCTALVKSDIKPVKATIKATLMGLDGQDTDISKTCEVTIENYYVVFLTPIDINIYPNVTVDFNIKIVPEPNLPVGEKLIYKWENTAQYGHLSENETASSYNDNFESEKDTVFYTANNSIKGTDTITVQIYKQKSDSSRSYMGEKSSTVNVDYQGSGKIVYRNTSNEEIWVANLDKIPPEYTYFAKKSKYNGEEIYVFPRWADRNYNSIIATSGEWYYFSDGTEPIYITIIGTMFGTDFRPLFKVKHHQCLTNQCIIGSTGEPGQIAYVNDGGVFIGNEDIDGNEFPLLKTDYVFSNRLFRVWESRPMDPSFGSGMCICMKNSGIYRKPLNNSTEYELLTKTPDIAGGITGSPAFSPDGKYIGYMSDIWHQYNSSGGAWSCGIWLYNIATQQHTQLKENTLDGINQITWSSDSKFITFEKLIYTHDLDMDNQIWTMDISTHKEILLMNKGGTTPVWASF